jgi:hypothetical protein
VGGGADIAKGLEFLSEVFDDYVADQAGDDGDIEIGGRKNVFDGEKEGLAVAICAGEFAHQEIGIEEKDDEADLDHRPPKRRQFVRLSGVVGHLPGYAFSVERAKLNLSRHLLRRGECDFTDAAPLEVDGSDGGAGE